MIGRQVEEDGRSSLNVVENFERITPGFHGIAPLVEADIHGVGSKAETAGEERQGFCSTGPHPWWTAFYVRERLQRSSRRRTTRALARLTSSQDSHNHFTIRGLINPLEQTARSAPGSTPDR